MGLAVTVWSARFSSQLSYVSIVLVVAICIVLSGAHCIVLHVVLHIASACARPIVITAAIVVVATIAHSPQLCPSGAVRVFWSERGSVGLRDCSRCKRRCAWRERRCTSMLELDENNRRRNHRRTARLAESRNHRRTRAWRAWLRAGADTICHAAQEARSAVHWAIRPDDSTHVGACAQRRTIATCKWCESLIHISKL